MNDSTEPIHYDDDSTRYENTVYTSISDNQSKYLRKLIAESGTTKTEYVREIIIKYLHEQGYLDE